MPLSDVDHATCPIDTCIPDPPDPPDPRPRLRRRLHQGVLRLTLALVIVTAAGVVGSVDAVAAGERGPASSHHSAARAAGHHHSARSARTQRSRHPHAHGHAAHKPPPSPRSIVPVSSSKPPPSKSAADTKGEIALSFARAQIGKPYKYGGSGPNSYDCSGLTQRSWLAAGVRIPRTTQQQAGFGARVPVNRMRAGDLVIFYSDASHVGIYAGGGKVVVAPHQGAYVTVQPIRWMPIYTVRRPG